MKKGLIFVIMLFWGIEIFAEAPNYTTQRVPNGNGMLAYVCDTENDALILLNNYDLPDRFMFVIPMKGISITEVFGSGVYMLDSSKLAHSTDYGYTSGLAILSNKNFDLDPNIGYAVSLLVELHPFGALNSSSDKYMALVQNIMDMNGNIIKTK